MPQLPAGTPAVALPAVGKDAEAFRPNDRWRPEAGLVEWEDFKYRYVLAVEVDGRILHAVANHLVIHSPGEDMGGLLREWADDAPDLRAERIAESTYLASWSGVEASLREGHADRLQALLGARATIEPDWIVQSLRTPNDPRFPAQYHLSDIFAPGGWAVRTDAPGITVAVLDSGIRRTHPDLVDRVRPRPGEIAGTGRDDDGNGFIDDLFGWDFVDNNNDPDDIQGHGTHVAGIIGAAGNNSKGGSGVAWDVTLLTVRFLDAQGRGATSDEIRALNYALASGVHIVNASYGTGGFSEAARARYAALGEAGIWVVAAAGNDAVDTRRFPIYPAGFDLENILSVGATNATGEVAGFSNFGAETVDLFAPGAGLLSTSMPDSYEIRSGTSQAAAVVAGALALLLAEYPALPPSEVRARIVDRVRFSPATGC
ncbi:MAG: S8 family serine peptidase [Opitutales bacterium]|nr:S8 family serine peptidase [Opitutales bacterium]